MTFEIPAVQKSQILEIAFSQSALVYVNCLPVLPHVLADEEYWQDVKVNDVNND